MQAIINELLQLTKKKMREAGEYGYEAYQQFIEESINFYIERGKLIEDDNLELIKDQLLSMYDTVKNKMSD